MLEDTVPATEAQEEARETEAEEEDSAPETVRYECAFHILPTVAEEEVPQVVEQVKAHIARAGGVVTEEEIAGQIDLAYEIAKEVGGARRKFNAAHFCWIRFSLAPSAAPALASEIGKMPEVLRHLVIRLTRREERAAFFMRDALKRERAPERSVDEDSGGAEGPHTEESKPPETADGQAAEAEADGRP